MYFDLERLHKQVADVFDEVAAFRRDIHMHPELSEHEARTETKICDWLNALDIPYEKGIAGHGICATIYGQRTDKTAAIRADIDALPVTEQTGLPYASQNEGVMHACGHDMHTAMLLGAAQLLMRHRQELSGTVKLVFQPDEEGFTGAKSMLAAGVLQNPAPGEALALHVHSGTPSGTVLCGSGTFMAGCTLFRITVRGKGCHGAMPETGVDPIGIAAQIWLALQEITGRELPAKTPAVVTVGRFQAGQAPNIIPDEAVLEGTVRTFDRAVTAQIMERIRQLSEGIASAFRGSAQMEELASAPPLQNDPALTEDMAALAETLLGREKVYRLKEGGMGSEDFASYTYELPCAYLLLGAGVPQEDPRYGQPMHNPKVVFNEDVLPLGAALLTAGAMHRLER